MSYNAVVKRYFLIIEKIAGGQFPTLHQISDKLKGEGFSFSLRTLQRDIEHIRNTFQIEIEYSKAQNGYFINKEKSINPDNFTRFLEVINTASIFSDEVAKFKLPHSNIMFEVSGKLRGIENIKSLLLAIKNKKKIRFTHNNYTHNSKKEFVVHPYLLKEYLYRWYIVGILDGKNEIRTFGIDRIDDLQILNEFFVPEKRNSLKELFKNTIGLVYSAAKPQEIILHFAPIQAKYIEALPLHHSQQKINENKKGVTFSIFVTPNLELVQQLLSWGEYVMVLKPLSLAKEIKKVYQKALKNYTS
jgi:predicted DNA-binding transcriptional regulator YafY